MLVFNVKYVKLFLQKSGTITVAMDGNFGLVRKVNSGQSYITSLYNDIYFLQQDETDSFIKSYKNDNAGDRVS